MNNITKYCQYFLILSNIYKYWAKLTDIPSVLPDILLNWIKVKRKRFPLVKKIIKKVLSVIYFEWLRHSSSDCDKIMRNFLRHWFFCTKMKINRLFFKKVLQLAISGHSVQSFVFCVHFYYEKFLSFFSECCFWTEDLF